VKVGLIDVDGHNFPNLPLMKLSAWHKRQGDSVEWYESLLSGHMNVVYMSKVFSFTPDYEWHIDSDNIIRGGTGYENPDMKELIYEAEHIYAVRDLGYWPYVMVYEKDKLPSGHITKKLQRWVNMRAVFESVPKFEDYLDK